MKLKKIYNRIRASLMLNVVIAIFVMVCMLLVIRFSYLYITHQPFFKEIPYCNNTWGSPSPTCQCNSSNIEVIHYNNFTSDGNYSYICEKTASCSTNDDCPSRYPICYDNICDSARGV